MQQLKSMEHKPKLLIDKYLNQIQYNYWIPISQNKILKM